MILTGHEIERQRDLGNIHISPFIHSHLGPNSYDLTLDQVIVCMDNPDKTIKISHDYILMPGKLYLGSSVETAISKAFIPQISTRSSWARKGLSTHLTAGFGDIGWGYDENLKPKMTTWTFEITVLYPTTIRFRDRLAQVYFTVPKGEISYYNGKYTGQMGPTASKLHEDKEYK